MNAQSFWQDAWARQRHAYATKTGATEDTWRASGRASKEFPNKENADWWDQQGPDMVQRWMDWRAGNGWQIWVAPNGDPAIELGIETKFADVPVKMVIDRVFVMPTGEMVIVDLKTGRSVSSDMQLAWYAAGMDLTFGIRPTFGTYWMAREGMTSPLVDLNLWPTERMVEIVTLFDKARKEGIFLPNFSSCKMCSVTSECKWYTGGTQ